MAVESLITDSKRTLWTEMRIHPRKEHGMRSLLPRSLLYWAWSSARPPVWNLSSNTLHIRAKDSGHEIHLYQPDTVVHGILEAVPAVRNKRPLNPALNELIRPNPRPSVANEVTLPPLSPRHQTKFPALAELPLPESSRRCRARYAPLPQWRCKD